MALAGQVMAYTGQTPFPTAEAGRAAQGAAWDVPGWRQVLVCRDGSKGTCCGTRAGELVLWSFGQGSAQCSLLSCIAPRPRRPPRAAPALPAPTAQALQDPTPNPPTSGHRVEDLSQLLTAPTLGKHRWESVFLETLPQHPPPGSPPASGLGSFRQTQRSPGLPGSRGELCGATVKSIGY